MTRIQANLLLLLAAAIWGGGFVAQSTAMDHLGANWFNALRFGIATIVLLPFAVLESRRSRDRLSVGDVRMFVIIGVLLFAAQTAQQFGLKTTTVTNASFLTGLYVVIVPVMAVVFLRHRPHWIIWPAALAALLGILLLSGGSLSALSTGDGLTILCAGFFAVQILLTGRIIQTLSRPYALATIQFAVTALLCTLAAIGLEPISLASIENSMTQILYGGLLSSGLAFSLQIIAQRYTSSSQAAIFMSSEALFGALLGAVILNESLTPIGYLGCALMFLAMLAVEIVPEWGKLRAIRQ
ncbi:DMT family transporter [Agrobacterium vitis]|uniref:EamA family transporter n=1 Tax=Agrobacterium vitis TaxID=373 RepID=A0AAE4WAD6_AGRVI|nr:DMT family transporter [Agrobacterium vitis]MCF1498548.1 DMT family transporter [Allorhizobium sp. Av2]MCM2438334.1 DMT family transporter [Agrobacterium vitis]MUZ56284.1 EamA family transporter [Agrobacterium vitis]MVA64579.1 EamA family transporter [Agrobacterium vitis]MVA85550.1 EamA family transporter [Agrobacterium vitis]